MRQWKNLLRLSLFTRWTGLAAFCFVMKEYAESFYKSPAWRDCRKAYLKSVGGLCERCLAKGLYVPGVIVHHKIYITPDNITDPNIVLNFENLELVCRDCHADIHQRKERRYKVDEMGRVVAR